LEVNNSGTVLLGQAGASGLNGTLTFNNSAGSNTVSLSLQADPGSSYNLLLPTTGPSTSQCLKTNASTATQLEFGSCGTGGSGTLSDAYSNGSAGDQVITLSAANDSVIIRDPSSSGSNSGTTPLYIDQLATGTKGGLTVALAADTAIGNNTRTGIKITSGDLTQSGTNTGTYYGLDITQPNLVLNASSSSTVINSYGIRVKAGSYSTSGSATVPTQYGFYFDGATTISGTSGPTYLYGLYIDNSSTVIPANIGATGIRVALGTINNSSAVYRGLDISTASAKTFSGANVDIIGARVDLSSNITATSTQLIGLNVLTAADSNISSITKTGIKIDTGNITETSASTGTYNGILLNAGGQTAQTTTAAGTLNWNGANITTPAATLNFAASIINENGILITNTAAVTSTTGTLTENGLKIVTGNITQNGSGTLIQNGIYVDSGSTTFTTGGTLYGVNVNIGAIAAVGTYYGLNLSTNGTARTFTAGATITGGNIDLNNNVTAVGVTLTGLAIATPADTNIANATKKGINISSGAITENTSSNTGTYVGADVTIGAATTTTGTALNLHGLRVTTGTVSQAGGTTLTENGLLVNLSSTTFTTGGNLNGIRITPMATEASVGTTTGLNIGGITTGGQAGASNAITIGANWDKQINGNGWSVDGSGNITVTGCTGCSSLTTVAFSSSTNANGGSISGATLTLNAAGSTTPGLVSAASQTFGGTKTFGDGLSATLGTSAYNLKFNDGASIVQTVASSAGGVNTLSINNSGGTNTFQLRDLTGNVNNFGGLAISDAFLSRQSYWGEEFSNFKATCTDVVAVSAVNHAGVRGDTTTANGTCTATSVGEISTSSVVSSTNSTAASFSSNAANGFERLSCTGTSAGSRVASCLETNNNGTAGQQYAVLNTGNLPQIAMKFKPASPGTTNYYSMGIGNVAAAVQPQYANTIKAAYFSNCTVPTGTVSGCGNAWYGIVNDGATAPASPSTNEVACPATDSDGSSPQSTNFMYGRIEFRKATATTAVEIEYFIDYDVTNGIHETSCGTVTTTGSAMGNTGMGMFASAIANGTNTVSTLDVDYFRAWQDDAPAFDTNTPPPDTSTTTTNSLDPSQSSSAADTGRGSASTISADDNLSLQAATVALDMSVMGALYANGSLTVLGPAQFRGEVSFEQLVNFLGDVSFGRSTVFQGRTTFNNDTAGFAVIHQGQQEIKVKFDETYSSLPVVTVNIKNGKFATYSYKDLTKDGFTIILKDIANEDVEFSWTALSVKDARTADVPLPLTINQ